LNKLECQPLIIYGAGGFGRGVLQVILDQNRVSPVWDFQGFLVDPGFPAPQTVHGFPVLGDANWLEGNPDVQIGVAIGAPADRQRITRHLQAGYGNHFATLVHPRAWLGEKVTCGEGTVICAGALIATDGPDPL
jgi:hypothetical protein